MYSQSTVDLHESGSSHSKSTPLFNSIQNLNHVQYDKVKVEESVDIKYFQPYVASPTTEYANKLNDEIELVRAEKQEDILALREIFMSDLRKKDDQLRNQQGIINDLQNQLNHKDHIIQNQRHHMQNMSQDIQNQDQHIKRIYFEKQENENNLLQKITMLQEALAHAKSQNNFLELPVPTGNSTIKKSVSADSGFSAAPNIRDEKTLHQNEETEHDPDTELYRPIGSSKKVPQGFGDKFFHKIKKSISKRYL